MTFNWLKKILHVKQTQKIGVLTLAKPENPAQGGAKK